MSLFQFDANLRSLDAAGSLPFRQSVQRRAGRICSVAAAKFGLLGKIRETADGGKDLRRPAISHLLGDQLGDPAARGSSFRPCGSTSSAR
jgi:hypothetical protein